MNRRIFRTIRTSTFFSPFLVFLISFFVISVFALRGIDPHHDGIMLKSALDVSYGKILFKETYFHYGPIAAYLHAFSLLFEERLINIRLITTAFYSATTVLIFLVTKKIVSDKAGFLTVLAWILLAPFHFMPFHPWPSVYGSFFTIAVFYVFVTYLISPKGAFLLGIFSSLAYWSKQPFLVLFISLIIYFLVLARFKMISIKHLKSLLLLFFIGFFTVSSVFILIFFVQNSYYDFYLQNIRTGYSLGRKIGEIFAVSNFLKYFFFNPVFLIFPLSILFFLVKSFIEYKNKEKNNFIYFLGFSFIAISSFIQTYPLFDEFHFFWAVTPLFPAAALSINLMNDLSVNRFYRFFFIFLLLILSVSFIKTSYGHLAKANERIQNYSSKIEEPDIFFGLYVTSREKLLYFDIYNNVSTFIKNNPEKGFVLLGEDALYTTFTKKAFSNGPMYANFMGAASGYYSTYDHDIEIYIKEEKPLVLVQEGSKKPIDYKQVKKWKDYNNKELYLFVPIK